MADLKAMKENNIMQYPIDLWDLLLLKMTALQVMFVVVLTRTKIIIGWKQTMTKTP